MLGLPKPPSHSHPPILLNTVSLIFFRFIYTYVHTYIHTHTHRAREFVAWQVFLLFIGKRKNKCLNIGGVTQFFFLRVKGRGKFDMQEELSHAYWACCSWYALPEASTPLTTFHDAPEGLMAALMSSRPVCCCKCTSARMLLRRPPHTLSPGARLIYKASNEVQQRGRARTCPQLIVCLFTFSVSFFFPTPPRPPILTCRMGEQCRMHFVKWKMQTVLWIDFSSHIE